MYHAANALAPNELRISGGFNIFSLVAGRAHVCLLNSYVPSNIWYDFICGLTCDFLSRLRESWSWLKR